MTYKWQRSEYSNVKYCTTFKWHTTGTFNTVSCFLYYIHILKYVIIHFLRVSDKLNLFILHYYKIYGIYTLLPYTYMVPKYFLSHIPCKYLINQNYLVHLNHHHHQHPIVRIRKIGKIIIIKIIKQIINKTIKVFSYIKWLRTCLTSHICLLTMFVSVSYISRWKSL